MKLRRTMKAQKERNIYINIWVNYRKLSWSLRKYQTHPQLVQNGQSNPSSTHTMLTSIVNNKFSLSHLFSFSQSHRTLFLHQIFFFSKSDFLSLFLFTISSNTLSLSTFFAFGCLNLTFFLSQLSLPLVV